MFERCCRRVLQMQMPCRLNSMHIHLAVHRQVWICMHYILWRIKKLEGLAGATDDDADLLRQNARAAPCYSL